MAWALLRRLSPLKRLRAYVRGTDQREVQRQADLHRLFLYTSLWQELQASRVRGTGNLTAFAQQVVEKVSSGSCRSRVAATRPQPTLTASCTYPIHNDKAKTMPAAELDSEVQRSLRAQLVAAARALHEELTSAGDGLPAAHALERADSRRAASHAGGEQGASAAAAAGGAGLAALGDAGSGGGGSGDDDDDGDGAGAPGGAPPVLDQARVSQLLRQRIGYSLAVRPSSIDHEEAGAPRGGPLLLPPLRCLLLAPLRLVLLRGHGRASRPCGGQVRRSLAKEALRRTPACGSSSSPCIRLPQ
jgi:hypothetical protein